MKPRNGATLIARIVAAAEDYAAEWDTASKMADSEAAVAYVRTRLRRRVLRALEASK